jgi:hypothetical protein
MYIKNITFIIALALLLGSAVLANAFNTPAGVIDGQQQPDLPPVCSAIGIDAGNEVAFHVYAIGVQIYRWDGSAWVFVAPSANLYADNGYHGHVGSHYGGPTWESVSGSKVIARKINDCSPNSTAVAWLKLQMTATDGPGIFSDVSFIQRVNTTGGIAPSVPGSVIGEEVRVPYTAEYYFYRAEG